MVIAGRGGRCDAHTRLQVFATGGLSVTHLAKGLTLQQMLLGAALLPWMVTGAAAEPLTSVAPAHGPLLMLYVSQPLGARGATRVYGLRLDQSAQQAALPIVTSLYASSPKRSLVDLQIRREADVRVEFGQRVTWSVTRRELNLSGTPASRGTSLVNSLAFVPAWRSPP